MPRIASGAAAALAVVLLFPGPVSAQAGCARAVVFTLPGVTWSDVRAVEPPELLDVIASGAAGSMSVRTIAPRTSYASGFATIGAGARVDGGRTTGGFSQPGARLAPATSNQGGLTAGARVAGLPEISELADEAGYGARPGALAGALDAPVIAVGNADLGDPPPSPFGPARWSALAAMQPDGLVPLSATGPELLEPDPASPFGVRTDPEAARAAVDAALEVECAPLVVDPGDLERADQASLLAGRALEDERERALLAADELLAHVRRGLDPERDLLLVLSPTSPAWAPVAHLGVAVAEGGGFPAGATIESSSTRRRGIVTLPDVAPTVLEHLGASRPAAMNGRPWVPVDAPRDPATAAIDLDEEAVFIDGLKGPVTTGFLVFQVIVYALALGAVTLRDRHRKEHGALVPLLQAGGLAVAAFHVAIFLAGIVVAHDLGTPAYVGLLVVIDAVIVAAALLTVREPFDRLLAVSAFTLLVMLADLMSGGRLQLNTVFGYSPIVAGRFAGAGNIAFALLAGSAVVTGALVVHRGRTRTALWAAAALFAVVVVIDGAPQFGSDVGGVLALVPGFAITWVLLSGKRPSVRVLLLAAAGAVLLVGLFLGLDLARPPEDRTHLGRLFEDVRERGWEVFYDTIVRKVASNLDVFRTTVWTYFVPIALGVMAWLLASPSGRWERLAREFPKVRAGLVGGLIVGVLGFAVNDSGIVIPAVVLSFLVPLAMLVHIVLDKAEAR